jgi:hypothetical protein
MFYVPSDGGIMLKELVRVALFAASEIASSIANWLTVRYELLDMEPVATEEDCTAPEAEEEDCFQTGELVEPCAPQLVVDNGSSKKFMRKLNQCQLPDGWEIISRRAG